MTDTIFPFRTFLLLLSSLMAIMRVTSFYATTPTDIRGTWSGTVYSNHSNVAPFTMKVVIQPDSRGRIVGNSSLTSHCLKSAHLEVTVTDSDVVLAGSDEEGNNVTLRGTLDNTGTLLKSTYILNGSATGGCETDDGTGTLRKR